MPRFDPVREAALNSPIDGSVSPPLIGSAIRGGKLNGTATRYAQPDMSSRVPAHHSVSISHNADSTPPAARRINSLANILTNDEDPSTARTAPRPNTAGSSQLSPRPSNSQTSSDEAAYPVATFHQYRPITELSPITLPPSDHRQFSSYRREREYDPDQYPAQPTRVSISPVATRSNSPTRTRPRSPEDILSFPHRPSRPPSLSPVAIRDAEEALYSYPHRPSRSPVSHRATPRVLSPVQSLRSIDDRPTTSEQPVIAPLRPSPSPPLPPNSVSASPDSPRDRVREMPVPSPPSGNPRSAPLPYAPRNRRTPAGSILTPLTSSELETYRHSRNPLRQKNSSPDLISVTLPPSDDKRRIPKRRRETPDDELSPPKRSRDADLVVEHYNARPNVDIRQRQDSPIIGLKNFNNWIKSVWIAKWGASSLGGGDGENVGFRVNRPRGKVLDMGCGKGGDLQKWQKARTQTYCGLDVAATSVAQARERATSLRAANGFTAEFHALDCYSNPLSDALSKEVLEKPFDVVSMQFCMHYAFENVSKVRMMLENVARYLRPGGRFLGTIPNDLLLMDRLGELPADSEELSFGNRVYRITFENRAQPLFGQRYKFFLLDAVEDMPEYVVHWENFKQLALEHGLHLIERKEFHDIFMDEREHKDYGLLLKKMKVVDDQGESAMDEDQWEAANVYVAFVFEKR